MKRVVLLSALTLVAGVLLLRAMQHDAGYVLIAVAGKTLEMRFWFAVAVLFVGALLLWGLLSLLSRVRNMLFNGWSFAIVSRAKRGRERTNSGFLQFIEGDWLGAKKTLLRAAKDVDQPVAQYLGAARSAYETGDFELAEELITKAQKVAPEQHVSILIGQARMLYLTESYRECLSVLHGVHTSYATHPVVLELLYQCYYKLSEWRALESILHPLEKHNILSGIELANLQVEVYSHLLRLTLDENTGPLLKLSSASDSKLEESAQKDVVATEQAVDSLEQTWGTLPKKLRKNTQLIYVYASLLKQQGEADKAEHLLRATLKKNWSESLVELYALLDAKDAKLQLQFCEVLLVEHSESAILHLALGRICLRCKIWGRAKAYFQSSIKAGANPVAYAELARLQAALDEHELSHTSYKQGLSLCAGELPRLPQPSRQPVFQVQAGSE